MFDFLAGEGPLSPASHFEGASDAVSHKGAKDAKKEKEHNEIGDVLKYFN